MANEATYNRIAINTNVALISIKLVISFLLKSRNWSLFSFLFTSTNKADWLSKVFPSKSNNAVFISEFEILLIEFESKLYVALLKAKVAINKAIVINVVPIRSRGLRPNLSINQIATKVKTKFVRPTTMAWRNDESVLPPACSKMVGA